jgi:hypothetical protein
MNLESIEREEAESIYEELNKDGFDAYIREDNNYIVVKNAGDYWDIFNIVRGKLPLDEYLLSPTRENEITIQKVEKS